MKSDPIIDATFIPTPFSVTIARTAKPSMQAKCPPAGVKTPTNKPKKS
jgi:hypothetical protein